MTINGRIIATLVFTSIYALLFLAFAGTETDSGFTLWQGCLFFLGGSIVGHVISHLINGSDGY